MNKWFQAPHGWTYELPRQPGYGILVENPDSIGFCTIYLCHPDGKRQDFGREFSSDRAKDRAERIFKQHL